MNRTTSSGTTTRNCYSVSNLRTTAPRGTGVRQRIETEVGAGTGRTTVGPAIRYR